MALQTQISKVYVQLRKLPNTSIFFKHRKVRRLNLDVAFSVTINAIISCLNIK